MSRYPLPAKPSSTGSISAFPDALLAPMGPQWDGLGTDESGAADWSGTFHQYANRLAHLCLLHELNGVDAWLVFVYLVRAEEVDGPRRQREWRAALEVLHGAPGLRRHHLLGRKVDVCLEVN